MNEKTSKTVRFPAKKGSGPKKPTPPKHLSAEMRSWWSAVVADWTIDECELHLLTAACEAWDRGRQARELLAKHGLTFKDRFGSPRARPEVAVERDSRLAFARLLKQLDLTDEPPREPGRPPRDYSV